MGLRKVLALTFTMGLISVSQSQSLQHEQQPHPVYNAYSPTGGQGRLPSYRATPRLVGVKVGDVDLIENSSDEYLVGEEGRNVRVTARPPFAYSSNGALLLPSQQQIHHQHQTPVSYAYVQQPGEPLPIVRRIRVNPSSDAATYGQYAAASPPQYVGASPYAQGGVQYTQNVPAVATYRPAASVAAAPQQRHVTYASASAPTVSPYRQVVYSQAQEQPQQPQYYAANPRPKLVQVSRPVLKVQKPLKQELEDEEEQYPSDPNPQYNFAFDVKDDDFTNYQNRQESRDKGVTKGSYSVVDPDGYVRTVTYEASKTGGFKAKVTREPTDVKIKFPVPTPAPEEGGRGHAQQPQQYAVAGPQYSAGTGATYTPRRYPHRLVQQQPQYAQ